MFAFGFIRGAILGVSLGLMSGLILKKVCRKKNNTSKNKINKKETWGYINLFLKIYIIYQDIINAGLSSKKSIIHLMTLLISSSSVL